MIDLSVAQDFNAVAFCAYNKIRNENDRPIEFKKHKFLVQPYLDESPRIAAEKAAQVGFSTLAIIRAAHLCNYKKANIIYTLPSKGVVKDFVTPKVDPLFSNNPALRNMIKNPTDEERKGRTVDSSALKRIGDRFLYFRSSWDEASGIAISADILINDEVDRSNQKPLAVYESRLDASKMDRPDLGWIWKFSNPSVPNYGVDEWFQLSDQKNWFIKCIHCNHWQTLDWPENIDIEKKIYICSKCQRELSDDNRANGEWVPKFKNREISGYWFSQMMVPWHTAEKIIRDSKKDPSVFYNFTLGKPYQSTDMSVQRNNIINCIAPTINPQTNVAIGVDNGIIKTFVCMNEYGIFKIGETESWDDIEDLRNLYNATMVIDPNPYPLIPKRLCAKYAGKVFINYYGEDTKYNETVIWGKGDSSHIVKSDRTKIIDAVVADIMATDVVFNMVESQLETYISHWKNSFRVIETNEKGGQKPVWKDNGKPDHFVHAHVYAKIAMLKTLVSGSVTKTLPPASQKKNSAVVVNRYQTTYDLSDAAYRIAKDQRLRKK